MLKVITDKPLVIMIDLPDGCTPGKWEAAQAFARAIAELQKKYPDKKFQFVPFALAGCANLRWGIGSVKSDVTTYLAIEN